jgi:2-dehydro-3-deoxyglucarate aldolase
MAKNLRGLWQQIPSTTISEILCQTSMDFVVLDTEHGAWSDESIFQCIQIITLCRKKCFVRLTEADLTRTRYCLDAGADGLIFSTVDSQDYLNKIKSQCFFPADGSNNVTGKRGYGLTRDNMWGEQERKGKRTIIVQIENTNGVKLFCPCVAPTLAEYYFEDVDFVDYYMIGPYDLSCDIGCAGDFDHPRYKDMMKFIKDIIPSNKLGYHVVKDIDNQRKELKDCGFLAFGMDTLFLLDGAKQIEGVVNGK